MICSTVGHLVDAGVSLEYGKNYDRYWNGELFIKQVCIHMYFGIHHVYEVHSSKKKLFQHSKGFMVLVIKLYF